MNIDLTTMKSIMENNIFALYIVKELGKNKYEGIRLDKRNNQQVKVIIEKYPQKEKKEFAYRVVDFIRDQNQKHY